MKLFLIGFLVFGTLAFSQSISVTVDGVTYQCTGGGSSNCAGLGEAFRKVLEYCSATYPPGNCAGSRWIEFKNQNPSCAYAGVSACLEFCSKQFSPGACTNTCSLN